ncbi:Secretion protein HlyD [Nitrosococcus oceani ATCC 19707]|uniref:Secretion protein HlyD n=2 Tax=Nitrosococcus oceani TaxID=1229 RepID=Q3JEC4_NITOC|nr:efflux RND transporter periplasmic adaptor subunit [Nitrosococcus oceani]ABA56822.1 Secretion protein HlyD [Nitrosococcus oceani ATCC 19707]EDZ65789.1 efflux transporter, RND family, MFP subunit, putative [Nitrosococcus oceani AFC27]KFI20775.1 hemolysin D [Nitrosococcus oceani C-27]GEM20579.1 hemolysin D [Nitrosococcus oceani]
MKILRFGLLGSLFLLAACSAGRESPQEGTPELGGISITDFTDKTELFVEFLPLVVGQESAFAVHLTQLEGFLPMAQGRVIVFLGGGDLPLEKFVADGSQVPRIFRPIVKPQNPGRRQLAIRLVAPAFTVTHFLGGVTVYPDLKTAAHAHPPEAEKERGITFLLEQQWQVDFALEAVRPHTLRESVAATGVVRPRSDGEVWIHAPTAGHLLTHGSDFPQVGMAVTQGQILAQIAPRMAGEADFASLQLAVQKGHSQYQFAAHERQRLEDLFKQNAMPKHRLIEARKEETIAKAELEAAQRRLAQYQVLSSGTLVGVPVRAPIKGLLTQVQVTAGSYLATGQALFHVVQTDRLWLEARIAEADLGRLHDPTAAWFEVEGFEQPFRIGPAQGARRVTFSMEVDEVSRTTPLVFEFPNPNPALRIGMFAQVHVLTGKKVHDLTVPRSALVDHNGQVVVYVLLGGESFERRSVQLGIRDGNYAQVREGLSAGERIVTHGAYLVHLAAASPAAPGHGHAH